MLLNRGKLNTVVQLTSHLTRIFGGRQAEDKSLRSVVYKVKPLSHYSDSWEWTIVEQSNGKTISNIVESLYLEALGNGARLADIGIWKSLFDRTVLAKVYQLADGGYIRLLNDREERQDSVPTSAMHKKGESNPMNPESPRTAEPANQLSQVPSEARAARNGTDAIVFAGRFEILPSFAAETPNLLGRLVHTESAP